MEPTLAPPPPRISDPFLKVGGENFSYLTLRGKLKKNGWKYGAGADLLKKGGWHFSDLIFQGLLFLHLKMTLSFTKLCYMLCYATIIL